MTMDKTKNTYRVDTNTSGTCDFPGCGERIDHDQFSYNINHYINNHGCKLLHVGQETLFGGDENVQISVAILGIE